MDDFASKGEALLEQFELVEKRRALAQELSRGMRQKVAICCAYLHEPKAILFDEPLTGLDPYAIRTLKASIADRAASGAAVMVSSHLLVLVEDLCTHLLILNKGQRLFLRLARRGPSPSMPACKATRRSPRSRTFSSERPKRPRGREPAAMHPCSLQTDDALDQGRTCAALFRGARRRGAHS